MKNKNKYNLRTSIELFINKNDEGYDLRVLHRFDGSIRTIEQRTICVLMKFKSFDDLFSVYNWWLEKGLYEE